MTRLLIIFALFASIITGQTAVAHELKPAYLEITETAAGTYDLLFKVPLTGDQRLALHVSLSENCKEASPIISTRVDGADIGRWKSNCAEGLAGQQVRIDGTPRFGGATVLGVELATGRHLATKDVALAVVDVAGDALPLDLAVPLEITP